MGNDDEPKLLCYNRGCGKTFSVAAGGADDECAFHPGAPFFHEGFKGWTCCDRKSVDFTEFLNFAGCTRGRHSRVRPVEPESITGDVGEAPPDPAPVREPEERAVRLARPDFAAPMARLEPTVARSLRDQLERNPFKRRDNAAEDDDGDEAVKVGEPCKNGGCKEVRL